MRIATFSLLAAFAFATPALAEEPHGGTPVETPAHGAEAGHGAEGGHAAAGGGHHVTFTDDDDKDGTANWMDADSGAYVLRNLGVQAANLVLFLAVVGFLARRALGDALGNRQIEIKKAIAEAADAHAAASAKAAEITRRLDALDAEIAKMKADASASIADEEQKLIQRANEEAARVLETADRSVKDELARAKVALRKEAVDAAVDAASASIKGQIHPSDQRRFTRGFLDALGGANG